MKQYGSFRSAIADLVIRMGRSSHGVHTEKWQGFDIKDKPEAAMKELLNVDLQVPLNGEDLKRYRIDIEPNLPWADDHFEERVQGSPVNPGRTWLTWPWANKADESRQFYGKFSHTYMERYWPKDPVDTEPNGFPMMGHRFPYGDLNDVVDLLAREPNTRQAYLPIFFPEDTGAKHGNRVPCTLGYHFIQRNGYLHIHYPIRSCDMYRHFRDDLYLTTRLLLWVLDELRKQDEHWKEIKPGFFTMWIGSLHMFINDWNKVYHEPSDT